MQEFWIQAIGFLALIMYLISYQFKSNRGLFAFQLLGALLFALQYVLMGATSGAASQVIKVARSLLLLKYNDWLWVRSKVPMLFFCGLYLLSTVLTWSSPLGLIILVASVVSTIAFWTNNARTIRVACLVCICPCWLIYGTFTGSLGSMFNEIFTIGSILISIHRFGWKALGEPQHK
jgi:hypothetical protein